MQTSDLRAFTEMMRAAHELRGVAPHSDTSLMLFFKLMRDYSIEQVGVAIEALLSDPNGGQYKTPIIPAHLIGQLQKMAEQDGRPSADEAWSIAIEGFDESASIVATQEILQCMAVARPLMEIGDKVAARKAFMAAYERAVRTARERRLSARWVPSLGTDAGLREQALERASVAGLLPEATVAGLLGRPETEPEYDEQVATENLKKIKGMLADMPTLSDKAKEASEAARKRQKELMAIHVAKMEKIAQEGSK